MIKLVSVATGLLIATLLTGPATAQSAPDCKAAWGNAACPPVKTAAAKPQITPKPRPEPGGSPKKVGAPAKSKSSTAPRQAADRSLGPQPYPGPPDQAWRRYRDWFGRYAAWYYAYGRYYGAPDRARMEQGPIRRGAPQQESRPGPAPTPDDRARLDPWHGYDSRDGLENGY